MIYHAFKLYKLNSMVINIIGSESILYHMSVCNNHYCVYCQLARFSKQVSLDYVQYHSTRCYCNNQNNPTSLILFHTFEYSDSLLLQLETMLRLSAIFPLFFLCIYSNAFSLAYVSTSILLPIQLCRL